MLVSGHDRHLASSSASTAATNAASTAATSATNRCRLPPTSTKSSAKQACLSAAQNLPAGTARSTAVAGCNAIK